MMKLLPLSTTLIFLLTFSPIHALVFRRSDVGDNNFSGEILRFVDRLYVPYGPDLTTVPVQSTQPWTGYGFGVGATEHWAYDTKERYIYSQSEAGGYITVIDYKTLPGDVTKYSMDVGGQNVEIRDIVVCSEQGLLFMTVSDRGNVLMYETTKRRSPAPPKFLKEITAGNSPDAMKLSNDCSILAVANQNEGDSILTEGAVTLVTNFRGEDGPTVKSIRLGKFDDAYLLGRSVHMPLTRNSMKYWDAAMPELGWSAAGGLLEKYSTALVFDPEFLAFNDDGTELYLNLQHNSALARIATSTGQVMAIDGYGLKAMPSGVDIVDDGECKLVTSDCLFLGRTPDGIATVEYEGFNYIFTADEGSDFDLDDYEEKFDSGDLFQAGGSFALSNFTFDPSFFVPGDSSQGCSANFQADCEANGLEWCSNFALSIGSSAVDYSDPTAPKMDKIVGFGGRGISIFKVPTTTDSQIEFVWDSASEFERETCNKFPWANNAVQDEEFAPVGGALWTLLDSDDREGVEARSDPLQDGCEFTDGTSGACPMSKTIDAKAQEDGLAVESVTLGIACDRLFAVGCGENNGVCLLYDVTDINTPKLIKTFNLSPASENKNPEESYLKDLGDLDPETTIFIPAEHSPTGKSGILFGGAISGTLSFYEFVCAREESTRLPALKSADSLSGGAIAGIVVGSLAVVAVLVFLSLRGRGGSAAGVEKTSGDSQASSATTASGHAGQITTGNDLA